MVTIPFMEVLKPYRKKIDALDDQIIDLLGQRLEIIDEVAQLKAQQGIAPILQDRIDEVRERCIARGIERGYDPDFIHALYTLIIDYSCGVEQEHQNQKEKQNG